MRTSPVNEMRPDSLQFEESIDQLSIITKCFCQQRQRQAIRVQLFLPQEPRAPWHEIAVTSSRGPF